MKFAIEKGIPPPEDLIKRHHLSGSYPATWQPVEAGYAAMLAAAPTPPVDENTSTEPVRNQAENEHIRLPEPMTDAELVEIYRALPKNSPIVRDGSTTIRLGRAVEAEVLRRVKEMNK